MLSLIGEAGKESDAPAAATAAAATPTSGAAGSASDVAAGAGGDASPFSQPRAITYTPATHVDKKVAKQASQSLPIVASFFRQCGEELLGVLSRKQRLFRARVPADAGVTWPAPAKIVPPTMTRAVLSALDRYFDAVAAHQAS